MVVCLALAVMVGLSSAALAWSQVRRTTAATAGDPTALVRALKRVAVSERLSELERRSSPGSWEHELAVQALAAKDEHARVAAVNFALSEVEHALTLGADWPRAAVRIALLGAGFLAFAAYVTGDERVEGPFIIVAVGAGAALASAEAGRSARRHAARQRYAIDALIATTFGEHMNGDDSPCDGMAIPPRAVNACSPAPSRRQPPPRQPWRSRRRAP